MTPHLLTVDTLSCHYGSHTAVDAVSFGIEKGEAACLLGPSGCGKTTTLRAIAGFERITSGSILLAGTTLSTPNFQLPPEKRHLGMVFQDYALFPHLTIRDNIAFGIHKQANSKATVDRLLDLTGLTAMAKRYPHELSGGQQQRVALARALAPEPRLLLLDEPFSNLDAELRTNLAREVRDILQAAQISAILVTHDQDEAFSFADKIGVMHNGKLLQWDTPENLYDAPATAFTARFIGEGCLIPGKVIDGQIQTELGSLPNSQSYPENRTVEVLVRPDHLRLETKSPYKGKVVRRTFQGSHTLLHIALPSSQVITVTVPGKTSPQAGEETGLSLNEDVLPAYLVD